MKMVVILFYLLKVWLLTNRQQCQNFFSWSRGLDLNKNSSPAGLEFVDNDQPTTFSNKNLNNNSPHSCGWSCQTTIILITMGTESVHCKINNRQLLTTSLRQAGLAELTGPQTNKYSVWCWCSCQIKNNKQEIMIAPIHHLPWSCGSGATKQISKSVVSDMSLVLTDFNKSLLINCAELFPTNQQKQKTSQSNKSANVHMAFAVDAGQK